MVTDKYKNRIQFRNKTRYSDNINVPRGIILYNNVIILTSLTRFPLTEDVDQVRSYINYLVYLMLNVILIYVLRFIG